MSAAKTCAECGQATTASYRLCDTCVAATTAAEREAQGLPAQVTDPAVLARLDRITRPAIEAGSAADAPPGVGAGPPSAAEHVA